MGHHRIIMGRSGSRSRSRSPPREERRRSRSRSPRGGEGGKLTGVACRWNDRGFGFIKPNDGGEDLFCHVSSIEDGNMLREGDTVEYEKVFDDRKGKYRAEKVTGGTTEERRERGGYDDRDRGRDRYDDRDRGRDRYDDRDRGRDRYDDRDRRDDRRDRY